MNLHGSWPLGLAPLVAALLAGYRPIAWRRLGARPLPSGLQRWLTAGALLSVAVLFANPVGPRLLARPFAMFGSRGRLEALRGRT